MQDDRVFIGLDVSKAELVVCAAPAPSGVELVANNVRSISAWLSRLPPGSTLGMESTGSYHLLLARLALAAGMSVYVLNAHDVHHYARGLGVRGKTDPSDAAVVRRYLVEHHDRLHRWQPGSAAQQQLQELLNCRTTIVQHRTAVQLTLNSIKEVGKSSAALDRAFDKLLQDIDKRVNQIIEADAAMSTGRRKLQSIVGIGPQVSATLTALFSSKHFRNVDAVVAYAGLDPRPDDSGKRRGRRRLSKRGPPLLRHQLFMAAFAGCHSRLLKPFYAALRARGLSSTEALNILARKILRIAWSVWNTGIAFDAEKLAGGACKKT